MRNLPEWAMVTNLAAPRTQEHTALQRMLGRARFLSLLVLLGVLVLCIAFSWTTRDAMVHLPFLKGQDRPCPGCFHPDHDRRLAPLANCPGARSACRQPGRGGVCARGGTPGRPRGEPGLCHVVAPGQRTASCAHRRSARAFAKQSHSCSRRPRMTRRGCGVLRTGRPVLQVRAMRRRPENCPGAAGPRCRMS